MQKAATEAGALSIARPANAEPIPRPEQAQARRSSLALPTNPAPQNQVQPQNQGQVQIQPKPKRKYTKRAKSTVEGSEAGSPAPSDTEGGRPTGLKRSGSGAKRSVIIEQRLQAALDRGEMPQFCAHCGAIETPTWRRLYLKEVDGKPSPLDEVEGEGETIGVEPLEYEGENGEVSRFLIRKSMKKTKTNEPGKGFEEITVCNPCGLWFNKFRVMRPAHKWKSTTAARKSRKRQNADNSDMPATDGPDLQSEAFFSERPGPEDTNIDPDLPEDDQSTGRQSEERQAESNEAHSSQGSTEAQRASAARPRANSLTAARPRSNDNASQRSVALARAVQSSPVRFVGSQESPIEIDDLTPKPTRRLLFPSPRHDGEMKSLEGNGGNTMVAVAAPAAAIDTKPAASLKPGVMNEGSEVSLFETFALDKENFAPGVTIDDQQLAHLFEGSPNAVFKTPSKTLAKAQPLTTPRTHYQQLENPLLKTPTPSASRKRKALSPTNGNAATSAAAALNDFMTSPSSSRYFLRSTPSREARTPHRPTGHEQRSPNGGGGGGGIATLTPFSRHLAAMLSDNNARANGGPGAFSSPGQAFDFSDMPMLTSPSRGAGLGEVDWSSFGGLGGLGGEDGGRHPQQ